MNTVEHKIDYNKMMIFPNPAKHSAKIVWDFSKLMTLKMYDASGTLVFQTILLPEMRGTSIYSDSLGTHTLKLETKGELQWTKTIDFI